MEMPSAEPILFISPVRQDQASLRRILCHANRTIPTATCRRALKRLGRGRIGIVLCDADLPDGSWLDILHCVVALDDPPPLIVTSRHADERLWAEVLNLGGFDVIAKPFNGAEVRHILKTACIYRERSTPRVLSAAGA
jgi:DNA-binding NtrC family response regulator